MQLFHTTVTDQAVQRVVDVLRSGFLNEGAVVKDFEAALGGFLSAPYVVCTNSATSALHLCLVHLGVGGGDEVIVPPQTFVATGLIVLHARATPVFADVDPHTGNLDARRLASRITGRTKAIIPVHWGGEPCDMDAINHVAADHGVPVIEDAAHAFGATYKGRMVGSLSRFTCFSFQAIKGMTTGDGGAITVARADDHAGLLRRRWFGMIKGEAPISEIGERSIAISTLGYKYHMNNVAAAIGLGNLEGYADRLARRRAIGDRYQRELGPADGVTHIARRHDSEGAFWLFPILIDRRDEFGRAMKARGIPVSIIDRRIDAHPVLGGVRSDLPGAAEFDARQIHLPIHEGLGDDDVGSVIAAVKKGW